MNRRLPRTIFLLVSFLIISGCTQGVEEPVIDDSEEKVVFELEKADSADEAMVVHINADKKQITLQNKETGLQYTLEYSGVTSFKNRYDEEIVAEQIEQGDVVITSFIKDKKLAKTVQLKKDVFKETEIRDFSINPVAMTMLIDQKQYQLSDHYLVMVQGKAADVEEVNIADTLRVIGTDYAIDSIVVEKGHGYIRLVNDEYFIGGWIDVGDELIKPITEDMLLVVPEGEYQVLISHKGHSGIKDVVVEANKETEVDVGDLKGEEAQIGQVVFTITPSSAMVYIDGKIVDYSQPVSLEYGIHQMVLKAEGYAKMTRYLNVNKEFANINITMETSDKADDEDETVSENSAPVVSPSDSSYTKVYIEEPSGARLYVDSVYIGTVPTSFPKVSGEHTITFRKTGYQTKSYTLNLDDKDKDVTYSFSELEAVNETEEEE